MIKSPAFYTEAFVFPKNFYPLFYPALASQNSIVVGAMNPKL